MGMCLRCKSYVCTVCHMAGSRKAAKKPQRTDVINIRVTPEQKQRFTEAAEAAGMDVSAFMRNATIEKIERKLAV